MSARFQSSSEPVTAARLAALLAQHPLFERVMAGRLILDIQSQGAAAVAVPRPSALMVVGAGDGRLVIDMPQALFDRILAEAPDPVRLADLGENDVGIMLEHILTPTMERLDAVTGQTGTIVGVIRDESIGPEFDPIGLTITIGEDVYPASFFVSNDRLRGQIAAAFASHNEASRSIRKDETVAIGPVVLTDQEAEAIAVGDVIVMDGAKFGRLSGCFLFDDGTERGVDLADGFATLKAPDVATPAGGVKVYFEVGHAARPGPSATGTRIQFLPFEGQRIFIRVGKHRIGHGDLVDAGGHLAISVKSVGGEA